MDKIKNSIKRNIDTTNTHLDLRDSHVYKRQKSLQVVETNVPKIKKQKNIYFDETNLHQTEQTDILDEIIFQQAHMPGFMDNGEQMHCYSKLFDQEVWSWR